MNRSKGANRLILALVLISILCSYLLKLLPDLDLYENLAVSQVIYLVPVIIYIFCTKGQILNELQIKPIRISTILIIILFTILMLPVMTWLNLISMLFASNHVLGTLSGGSTEASLLQNWIYIALLPAVSEEFMFRGIFYHSYRPAGVVKAALATGLCFGMLHMNLNQFCYAFVLGTAFAFLVEATGSIFSSMLSHCLINTGSVLILWLSNSLLVEVSSSDAAELTQRLMGSQYMLILAFYTLLALTCGALAICVLIWLSKRCGRKEYMRMAVAGKNNRGRVISLCLVLAVLVAFGVMLWSEGLLPIPRF